MSKVSVCTREFRRSHVNEPRGRGCWMFQFGDGDYNPSEGWSAPGFVTFSEARKAAVAEARRRGEEVVRVMP